MTTLNITLTGVCAGGDHATISISINGGQSRPFMVGADELRSPLSDDDRQTAIVAVLKLAMQGLTKIELRDKLQAGLQIVL